MRRCVSIIVSGNSGFDPFIPNWGHYILNAWQSFNVRSFPGYINCSLRAEIEADDLEGPADVHTEVIVPGSGAIISERETVIFPRQDYEGVPSIVLIHSGLTLDLTEPGVCEFRIYLNDDLVGWRKIPLRIVPPESKDTSTMR